MVHTRRFDVRYIRFGKRLHLFFDLAKIDSEEACLLTVCYHQAITLMFVHDFYQRPQIWRLAPPCPIAYTDPQFLNLEEIFRIIYEHDKPSLWLVVILDEMLRALSIRRKLFPLLLIKPLLDVA